MRMDMRIPMPMSVASHSRQLAFLVTSLWLCLCLCLWPHMGRTRPSELVPMMIHRALQVTNLCSCLHLCLYLWPPIRFTRRSSYEPMVVPIPNVCGLAWDSGPASCESMTMPIYDDLGPSKLLTDAYAYGYTHGIVQVLQVTSICLCPC